jgi:2-iminobutanoate/2-iminopropanoate deaminase
MKRIISTPNAPAAIGPYSQAVEANNTLYLSGQIPIDPATGTIVEGGITEQTHQVLRNIQAILDAAGYAVSDVVKSTVYLADMQYFAEVNAIYKTFYTNDFPARSAFAVKGLPLGALVEIETIAAK